MKQSLIPLLVLFAVTGLGCNSQQADHLVIQGINYLDGKPVSIALEGGQISSIKKIPEGADTVKVYVAPGLIDIQINGYMGIDFADQDLTIEGVRAATQALWKEGVTTYLPTLITADRESLLNSFLILSRAMNDEVLALSIPGFHLEGPYISPEPGFRGAHLEKYIREPDWNEFRELQTAAMDGIKIITVAPEINGAIPFLSRAVSEGVLVSLGHHNGNASQIRDAVDAGASLSTHLGNGCANMINRHNNPIWPQLADDRLSVTLIADGFHLNQEELQTFYKVKGNERTILVSDALDLAGLEPGEYNRWERTVVLTPDVVLFPAENVLAGAASPISSCVMNMMKFTGCDLSDAIQMASTNPARLLGFDHIGELKRGMRADIILFTIEDGNMVIQQTLLAGKVVYSKD